MYFSRSSIYNKRCVAFTRTMTLPYVTLSNSWQIVVSPNPGTTLSNTVARGSGLANCFSSIITKDGCVNSSHDTSVVFVANLPEAT